MSGEPTGARKAMGCVLGLTVFFVLAGLIAIAATLIEETGVLSRFPMKIATLLGLGAAAIGYGVYEKFVGGDKAKEPDGSSP